VKGGFLAYGLRHEAWCTPCKAFTALAAPLLLVTEHGVQTIGSWAMCDVCADPDLPEVRIGHR